MTSVNIQRMKHNGIISWKQSLWHFKQVRHSASAFIKLIHKLWQIINTLP